MQFNTTFYASPVVLVSVHHLYNPQVGMKSFVSPENNIISAWVEVNKQAVSISLYERLTIETSVHKLLLFHLVLFGLCVGS